MSNDLFSMKDVDGLDFENAYQRLQALIANLCKEHTYLLESNEIDPDDKEIFLHLKAGNGNQSETTPGICHIDANDAQVLQKKSHFSVR